jgi:acid phosphatase type 7
MSLAPVVVALVIVLVGAALVAASLLGGTAPGSAPASSMSAAGGHTAQPAEPARSPSPIASAGPDDVSLIAAGDIARCDATADDETGALASSLPGVIATLGDTAYDSGSTKELEECFGGSWGAAKDRIRYAVTGNHDIKTDDGAPLRAYLGTAAARDGRTWFSDDLGAWHVVVLDANCGSVEGGCGPDSPQVRWLRDDLAASSARCTLAMWHQPRFSGGDHGDATAVAPFWDVLYAAGADLVLNGHDHDYERFAPQDPTGALDEARGITQIVVGTGGGKLRDFKHTSETSVARTSDTYGVLQLVLRPAGWSFRFAGTTGAFNDQGDAVCH